MSNFWETGRIRLRAAEPEDWDGFYAFRQDSESMRRLSQVSAPQSRAAVKKEFEEATLKKPENDTFFLVIETLAGELIGGISTHDCNLRTGTFSYGVSVFPHQQRKGYASEAILLLLRYMFEERRYQKCTAEVFDYNPGSIALHERLGFQLEGRLRRMRYTQSQFYDIVVFGMTAEEFAASQGDRT